MNIGGKNLSQDSIRILCLWTWTLFESGLYSSQASIQEFTVDVCKKMQNKENPGVLDLQKIDFNTYGRHKA